MKGGDSVDKIIKSLGLSEDATEDDIVAEIDKRSKETETLKNEKSKLESDKQELTTAVESEKVRSKTLEDSYKQLLDSKNESKEDKQDKNLFDELSEDTH